MTLTWMHSYGTKRYARFPHEIPIEHLRDDGILHVRISQRAEGGTWFKAEYNRHTGKLLFNNGFSLDTFNENIRETYVITDKHAYEKGDTGNWE